MECQPYSRSTAKPRRWKTFAAVRARFCIHKQVLASISVTVQNRDSVTTKDWWEVRCDLSKKTLTGDDLQWCLRSVQLLQTSVNECCNLYFDLESLYIRVLARVQLSAYSTCTSHVSIIFYLPQPNWNTVKAIAILCAEQVLISRKRWKMETLLLQTANSHTLMTWVTLRVISTFSV